MKLDHYPNTVWSLVLTMFIFSCGEDPDPIELPEVKTSPVVDITTVSAVSGGDIVSSGSSSIQRKGVIWSDQPDVTIEDEFTNDGDGSDSFISSITGLLPNSTYYVRAYAFNESGFGLGEELEFTTSPACRLVSFETTSTNTYPKATYEYDIYNRVSQVNITNKNGSTYYQSYDYVDPNTLEILTNGTTKSYEMFFNGDSLIGFNKYFSATNLDINEFRFIDESTFAIVQFQDFGPGGALIPIDSAIYHYNDQGNIDELVRYVTNSSDRENYRLFTTYTFQFDDKDNPLKGSMKNFEIQLAHTEFVKYFNNNNIAARLVDDVSVAEFSYTYDSQTEKPLTMTSGTLVETYKYENCNNE